MNKEIKKRIPDCTCCGLLNSSFSISVATWFMILLYIGEMTINICINNKFSYHLIYILFIIFTLILLLIGLSTKKKQYLNTFSIYGVFLFCQIFSIILICIASGLLIFRASDKGNIDSFREKLRNSVFNIDESKYSDDDIIGSIKLFSIIEIVWSIIFICIAIPYFFATLHYADQLVQAIEEEEEYREMEKRQMTKTNKTEVTGLNCY